MAEGEGTLTNLHWTIQEQAKGVGMGEGLKLILEAIRKYAKPISVVGISIAVIAFAVWKTVGEDQFREEVKATVDDGLLRSDGRLHKKLVALIDSRIEHFDAAGTPVGAIVAWPLEVLPGPSWYKCNGDPIDVIPGLTTAQSGKLRTLLDSPRVPDFRGYFLRGEGTAHDEKRTPISDHKSKRLGEPQVEQVGKHTHLMFKDGDRDFEDGVPNAKRVVLSRKDNKAREEVSWASGDRGERSYSLAKGDAKTPWLGLTGQGDGAETRPINKSVHWIIRVK